MSYVGVFSLAVFGAQARVLPRLSFVYPGPAGTRLDRLSTYATL